MSLTLQDIGIGASANDGTGDTPRAAGTKINANNAAIIAYLKALANLDTVGTAQIDNSAVTLAKIANVANNRILGNVNGGSAAPSELTAAQVKSMLGIAAADVSGVYSSTQVDTLLSSYLTTSAASAAYQPLDSDLTAIAALTTTTFGRSLLTQADAAAARTTLGVTASSPGGSSGQVQYNNAGSFGGVTGITLATGTLSALAITGGTVTSSTPVIDATQTWNSSGVTFTGLKLNVTNTASAAASMFIDFQLAGSSKFNVTRLGGVGITTSSGYSLDVLTTGISSTREQFARFRVSDAGNDSIWIGNATSSDSGLIPMFAGYQDSSSARSAFQLRALTSAANDASDSSTFGLLDFTAFRTDSATDPNNGTLTAISNRKVLTVRIDPSAASLLTVMPSGLVAIGTIGASAPALYPSSTSLQVKLADNSAYTRLDAGSLSLQTDTILARDAANTLALRNSTNAQTFNWYFSFTDSSNYTRGALKTSSGVVEVAAESAGTGTANIDVKLTTKGTGVVQYGTHSAIAAETVTGYITIKDAGGTTRKLAVVS